MVSRSVSSVSIALFLAAAAVGSCLLPQPAKEPTAVKVGVYDSRAVAVAFAQSAQNRAVLDDLMRQHSEAKRANATERVAALEAKGAAMQERLHRQGFSTASIADILKPIAEQLPAIAQQAGVDVLMSKWDVAYRGAHVEFVDVTEAMIAPFAPTPEVRKMIDSLVDQEPLSLYEHDWDAHED
jgi:hypothetical protein